MLKVQRGIFSQENEHVLRIHKLKTFSWNSFRRMGEVKKDERKEEGR